MATAEIVRGRAAVEDTVSALPLFGVTLKLPPIVAAWGSSPQTAGALPPAPFCGAKAQDFTK